MIMSNEEKIFAAASLLSSVIANGYARKVFISEKSVYEASYTEQEIKEYEAASAMAYLKLLEARISALF